MSVTTRDEIRGWLNSPRAEGASHMLVVCDTFEWDDYPVYVHVGQDVREVAKRHDGPNMTKLMEVYNLYMDHEQQLATARAFNY